MSETEFLTADELVEVTGYKHVASKLLGHTEHEITEKVYRRVGETVKPTK